MWITSAALFVFGRGQGHPEHLPEARARDMEAEAAPVFELHGMLGFPGADGQVASVTGAIRAVAGPRRDRRRIKPVRPLPDGCNPLKLAGF